MHNRPGLLVPAACCPAYPPTKPLGPPRMVSAVSIMVQRAGGLNRLIVYYRQAGRVEWLGEWLIALDGTKKRCPAAKRRGGRTCTPKSPGTLSKPMAEAT